MNLYKIIFLSFIFFTPYAFSQIVTINIDANQKNHLYDNDDGYQYYDLGAISAKEGDTYKFEITLEDKNSVGYRWKRNDQSENSKYISQADNADKNPYLEVTYTQNDAGRSHTLYGCIWGDDNYKKCYQWDIDVAPLHVATLNTSLQEPKNAKYTIEQTIDIISDIENTGQRESDSVEISFFVNEAAQGDVEFYRTRVGRLNPKEKKSITAKYTFSIAGTYTIKACIIDKGRYDRLQQTCSTSNTYEVQEKQIAILDLFSLSLNPSPPVAQEVIKITATIDNSGKSKTKRSPKVTYTISQSNAQIFSETESVDSINAKTTRSHSIEYTFRNSGSYTIQACITDKDSQDQYRYDSQLGQCEKEIFQVGPATAYAIYNVTSLQLSKSRANRGDTIQLTGSLKNEGQGSSHSSASVAFSVRKNGASPTAIKEINYGYLQSQSTKKKTVDYTFQTSGDYVFSVCIADIGEKDSYKESDRCKEQKITVLSNSNTPPTTPTSISASQVDDTNILMVWGKSSDKEGGTISYLVSYKKVGGSFGEERSTNITSLSFLSLQPNTSYIFRVRAKDSSENFSGYKESSPIQTKAKRALNQPPSTPTNITIETATKTAITISWEKSTDVENDSITYLVSYKQAGRKWQTERSTSSMKKVHSGLQPNTVYYFRVRAKDAKGNYSDYLNKGGVSTQGDTLINTPPVKPGAISIDTVSHDSITLSWTKSFDAQYNTIDYHLSYKKDDGSLSDEVITQDTNHTYSKLESDTVYYFRIKAFDGEYYSDYQESGAVRTSIEPISKIQIERELLANTYKIESYFYVYGKGAYDWILCYSQNTNCYFVTGFADNKFALGKSTISPMGELIGFWVKYSEGDFTYVYIEKHSKRVFKLGDYDSVSSGVFDFKELDAIVAKINRDETSETDNSDISFHKRHNEF